MATAQTILEAGINRSTSNDPGKLSMDSELLGLLNRKYQTYHAMLGLSAPDRALGTGVVAMAGSPPAGTLPTDMVDLRRVQTAAGVQVSVVPVDEKDRSWHLAPAVYRQGNTIVSLGRTGDPVAAASLTIYYVDAPGALSALGDTLDARFPVQCHELLVLDVALYLSAKDEGRNPSEYERLKSERDFHWQAFTALVASPSGALTSPHGRPASEKA